MTYEDFYGDVPPKLRQTETEILDIIRNYTGASEKGEIKPVVYYCSRMKAPESVLRKCRVQGFVPTKSPPWISRCRPSARSYRSSLPEDHISCTSLLKRSISAEAVNPIVQMRRSGVQPKY